MAANFGASNQVMGVRQTADFLEKSHGIGHCDRRIESGRYDDHALNNILSSKSEVEKILEQQAVQANENLLPSIPTEGADSTSAAAAPATPTNDSVE